MTFSYRNRIYCSFLCFRYSTLLTACTNHKSCTIFLSRLLKNIINRIGCNIADTMTVIRYNQNHNACFHPYRNLSCSTSSLGKGHVSISCAILIMSSLNFLLARCYGHIISDLVAVIRNIAYGSWIIEAPDSDDVNINHKETLLSMCPWRLGLVLKRSKIENDSACGC